MIKEKEVLDDNIRKKLQVLLHSTFKELNDQNTWDVE